MTNTEVLTVRVPTALYRELAKRANGQMLTMSSYVRLLLAQRVGLIESPSVLVDPSPEYQTTEVNDD
jgi:hypothetical protein